ncbi:MAG: hypothetical protein ACD_58C00177G0007 [uncultured bacterium]|nr:MAG: hypothetical protein ACD_58C00177G0007 [uncultured bacterium]
MKLKTSKSAIKRIKNITPRGKVMVSNMSAQHRTTGKSPRTLRNSAHSYVVSSANMKTMKKLIPGL